MPMRRLTEHLGYEPNKTELRADLEALRKEAIIYNVLGKDGKTARGDRALSASGKFRPTGLVISCPIS